MSVMGREPTDAVNSFVEEQAKDQKDSDVWVYTFSTKLKLIKQSMLKDWKKLDVLVPSGMTALFDALGDVISTITEKNGVLLLITDGKDNSSETYSLEKVKEMMKTLRQEKAWNIITLGANPEAMTESKSLGIKNVVNFEQNTPGNLTRLTRDISRGLSSHLTQNGNVSNYTTPPPPPSQPRGGDGDGGEVEYGYEDEYTTRPDNLAMLNELDRSNVFNITPLKRS